MGCGRRAVQHPRIPRALADLLRARHDRRDAMTRRHITDLVAACFGQKQFCEGPAHRRPGCGLSWARLFCDGLALTDLTMSSSSRPGGRCCKGLATELLFGPIQMPHAGHVDCMRGWRLTGSRRVWCTKCVPVLLAGGVRGLVWKGATAHQPYGGATR